MTRTTALIKAQKKYDKKRGSRPSLTIRMSEEEKAYCEKIFGLSEKSKKETLLKAFQLLEKTIDI